MADILAMAHQVGHTLGASHTGCDTSSASPKGAEPAILSGIMNDCQQLADAPARFTLDLNGADLNGSNSGSVSERARAMVESVGPTCRNILADPTIWHEFFAVDTRETPFVGDFNGDGKADIITFTRDNPSAIGDVYAALSDGTRFGTNTKWHDFFAISHDELVVIGDYDGDGKDDIGTWLKVTTRQIYVAKSLGNGMAEAMLWLSSIGSGDAGDTLFAGDANGDGKDDLILFARSQGKVYVSISTGFAFTPPTIWHNFFAVSTFERPRVGDLNGDGKVDILTFATDSPTAFGDVYTAISTGAMFGDGANSNKWHDHFAINPTEEIRIGDRTGDRKDDLFTFLPAPFHQVYTAPSLGTSMGANALHTTWNPPPVASDKFYLGDANGDGKTDIIWFAQTIGKVKVLLETVTVDPCTIDTDGDRLMNCVETNTGTYVSTSNTGSDPNNADTDGDGIKDGDEVLGTTLGLKLPEMGASPVHKDIFVEYDWYQDGQECSTHEHKPTQAMLDLITAMFAAAPNTNPDGITGIRVHHDIGQGSNGVFDCGNRITIDPDGDVAGGIDGAEFLARKALFFCGGRDGYFHYVLMTHYTNGSSRLGESELKGDDMMVSMRCGYSNTNNVAAAIAHEIGHNLGLRHGGFEDCDWKPNYNSIMNAKYMLNSNFVGVDNDCTPPGNGIFDFSKGVRIDLNENSLNENMGICGTPAFDWNGNTTIETGVTFDVNRDFNNVANNTGCSSTLMLLKDHNDWAAVDFSGISDPDFAPEVIQCGSPQPGIR